jgi:preprotein translocase subunit YajC
LKTLIFLADSLQPASNPTTGGGDAPAWFKIFGNSYTPLIVVGVLMLWIMSKSKGGKDKNRQEMLKQLKRGDRIQTIGGILGTVLRTEENRVEVKVDEANNTKMWFTRSAIHQVLTDEKENAK